MTINTNSPSPTAKAATIGTSGTVAYLLSEAAVRYLHLEPQYVGALVVLATMMHRWLAVWYANSNGTVAVKLRAWFGNPLP